MRYLGVVIRLSITNTRFLLFQVPEDTSLPGQVDLPGMRNAEIVERGVPDHYVVKTSIRIENLGQLTVFIHGMERRGWRLESETASGYPSDLDEIVE